MIKHHILKHHILELPNCAKHPQYFARPAPLQPRSLGGTLALTIINTAGSNTSSIIMCYYV